MPRWPAARARRLLLFSVALSGALASPALALDPRRGVAQYVHRTYQARDGLPMDAVGAVLQDREGFLWVGTAEGLARFDGGRFRVYDTKNTPALRSPWITALEEDARGDLWVGTQGGDLLRKRGEEWLAFGAADGLPRAQIHAVRAQGDRLWVATGAGLAVREQERFRLFTRADGLPDDEVLALLPEGEALWAGTRKGLVRREGGAWVAGPRALAGTGVAGLARGKDGALWAATIARGLARLRGEETAFLTVPGLRALDAYRVLEDRDGNVWAATAAGLARVRGERLETAPAVDPPSTEHRALVEDRDGNLWFGTGGTGLNLLADGAFETIGASEGLPSERVNGMLQDAAGRLWLGTDHGLVEADGGHFRLLGREEGLEHPIIYSLLEDRSGGLWVGSGGGGLGHLQNGRLRWYGAGAGLSSLLVRALHQDRDGRVWAGTDRGLWRLEGARFVLAGAEAGVPAEALAVSAIAEDAGGRTWVGTQAHGLFELREGRLAGVPGDPLPGVLIDTLAADPDGSLWIGTVGGGLHRLRAGRFQRFTTREGLVDDVVFRVLDDGQGALWLSSNHGVARVLRAELEEVASGLRATVAPQVFGVEDGLRTRECNGGFQPAGLRARDGRLWFPTNRGAVVVDPARLRAPQAPRPLLERLLVDGRALPAPSAPLELGPGVERLEIAYGALGFSGRERTRYRYRLEGFDRGWVDGSEGLAAHYTNLGPGPYRFQLQAGLEAGAWSAPATLVQLRVRPRLYQAGWFQALCGGALLLGLFGVVRLRVGALRRRSLELEQLVATRTTDLTRRSAELEEARGQLEQRVQARTAELQAELAERKRLEEQLLQTQKLESIGRLAGGIAHDLNNLLGAVLGYTEFAQDEAKEPRLKQDLEQVRLAADRASALVRQLLIFARRQVVEPQVVGLNELTIQLDKMMRRLVPANVEMVVLPAPDLWMVKADPNQLEQVLVNLVVNARDAMPSGGKLVIETGNVRLDQGPSAPLAGLPAGDYVSLSVKDAGTGMSDEVKGHLFEPFFTTKAPGKGTGLGLATIYGIVRQAGGAIEVTSRPGEGSTFRVLLPRCRDLPERTAEQEAASAPSGAGTVLLVEDEPQLRMLAARILESRGYTVVQAADGEEAERIAESRLQEIDVLLTDLVMPRLGGIELAQRLRERRPGLQVIVTSGYLDAAAGAGQTPNFLSKPYTAATLCQQVRKVLAARPRA